jgi:hypothetical protein
MTTSRRTTGPQRRGAAADPSGTPAAGAPTGAHPRPLPQRPALRPGVHRLWRGPEQLQLGRDPRRAVVVTEVDDAVWDLLQQLDGRHTTDALLASARVDTATALALLHRLDAAGLIDDAAADRRTTARLTVTRRDQLAPEQQALVMSQREPGAGAAAFRRRARAVVAVVGLGRVGASLAQLLDASGVGHLQLVDEAEVGVRDVGPAGHRLVDVSRSRSAALRDRMASAPLRATGRRRGDGHATGDRPADLVVLTDALPLGDRLRRSDELGHADVPHLAIDVTDGVGRVGPLVLPGRSACLRCLDQARADRDPQWPLLLAQLVDAPEEVPSTLLAAQLAASAAAEVCTWLDDASASTLDAQLLVEPPAHQPRRCPLPRHPGCGCAWGGTIAS